MFRIKVGGICIYIFVNKNVYISKPSNGDDTARKHLCLLSRKDKNEK